MSSPPTPVTQLLLAWSKGDRDALEDLLPVVYAELRRIAGRSLRRERPDHTLRPTALVHEAYVKRSINGTRSGRTGPSSSASRRS